MFSIVNYPPGFGECTFCKKHDCGVNEEGEQYWMHSGIELDQGGNIVIGYKCVKLMADNMNITVKVVEKPIHLTPTDEQIGDFVRKAVNLQAYADRISETIPLGIGDISNILLTKQAERESKMLSSDYDLLLMERDELKVWFKERGIPFTPQWGEERLREEALKHV